MGDGYVVLINALYISSVCFDTPGNLLDLPFKKLDAHVIQEEKKRHMFT